MYRFAFVMDQQVGLRTQALNYERIVSEDPSLSPAWVPVCYTADPGLLGRLPALPRPLRDTLRGLHEIRDGLHKAGPCDAVLWATWAAKSALDLVSAAPAFLVMDMTPQQMQAMGAHYGYSHARSRFLHAFKQRATTRLYQAATHLFPWNQWVAHSLRHDYGVPEHKITPLCPGVDLDLFQPAPTQKPHDDVTRLLFVGGDFHRKGGDRLLQWAKETRVRARWEVHLVTREAVPPTPGVVVHAHIGNNSPELVRLYQHCDLFVLPTRADCYSLVAMEAMACGLPVVISALGGINEIVEEGTTGHLIDACDDTALALPLDRLVGCASLRESMGQAGRERAQQHFDCRRNLGVILEAMKQYVGAPPHRMPASALTRRAN